MSASREEKNIITEGGLLNGKGNGSPLTNIVQRRASAIANEKRIGKRKQSAPSSWGAVHADSYDYHTNRFDKNMKHH